MIYRKLVIVLCLSISTMTHAQNLTTCDISPPCKQLPTLNITLQEYASYSPFYEQDNQYIKDSKENSGSCVTYFPADKSTYIVFRSIRTKSEETNIEIYIVTEVNGELGTFRLQGLSNLSSGKSSAVFNAYVVGSGCESCSFFFLFHVCYLLGDEAYVHPVDELVFGAFTSPDPPSTCLDQYELLVDRLGFSHSAGFARASGPMPPCVARFNNNTCINAHTVDLGNAISYP